MRPRRYVGVSGVTTPEQAWSLLDAWPVDAPAQSLMIGALVSQKTLDGGERDPRSPAPETILHVFQPDRRALNLVHYFTKDTNNLYEQLMRVVAVASEERCDGVQINVPWPPVDEIAQFRCAAPEWMRVVLQVGPKAIEQATSGYKMTHRIEAYEGLVTDVLVDVSGGRGTMVQQYDIWQIVDAVHGTLPNVCVGVAGGLCAETLEEVRGLIERFSTSIYAESRLRNERDEFDLDKARRYLNAAVPLVCGAGK